MGSGHSSGERTDDDDGDDGEDEEEEEEEEEEERRRSQPSSKGKVLEQEPEVLPCRAAASPLSPQLSSAAGTPRLLGPALKVWDPCHVLLPPPPPPLLPLPRGSDAAAVDRPMEVLLVAHGECGAALRPDLVGGRSPAAGLTANGERQARALAVLLNSQGVRFSGVYSSPLSRARTTAAFVCRELNYAEEQIQCSEALNEMSQGQWEGCLTSEIYTPDMVSLIDRTQPDFAAPLGESLRQVEFRMVEFLNRTVLRLPEKLAMVGASNETKEHSHHSPTNLVQDRDGPHWDLHHRLNPPGLQRKKSSKSRLQNVTTGDNEAEDEVSPRELNHKHLLQEASTRNSTASIGIFTHAMPIKCLLAGLLHCSPMMSHKICVDDSSVTVLRHSLRTGWQIMRLNDTAHLRLL